jgi:hypothetical protein
MDLGEVGWGDVDWIGLAQDSNRWRALLNEDQSAKCYSGKQKSKVNMKLHLCLINEAQCHENVWGPEEQLHIFSTLALGGGEWSA